MSSEPITVVTNEIQSLGEQQQQQPLQTGIAPSPITDESSKDEGRGVSGDENANANKETENVGEKTDEMTNPEPAANNATSKSGKDDKVDGKKKYSEAVAKQKKAPPKGGPKASRKTSLIRQVEFECGRDTNNIYDEKRVKIGSFGWMPLWEATEYVVKANSEMLAPGMYSYLFTQEELMYLYGYETAFEDPSYELQEDDVDDMEDMEDIQSESSYGTQKGGRDAPWIDINEANDGTYSVYGNKVGMKEIRPILAEAKIDKRVNKPEGLQFVWREKNGRGTHNHVRNMQRIAKTFINKGLGEMLVAVRVEIGKQYKKIPKTTETREEITHFYKAYLKTAMLLDAEEILEKLKMSIRVGDSILVPTRLDEEEGTTLYYITERYGINMSDDADICIENLINRISDEDKEEMESYLRKKEERETKKQKRDVERERKEQEKKERIFQRSNYSYTQQRYQHGSSGMATVGDKRSYGNSTDSEQNEWKEVKTARGSRGQSDVTTYRSTNNNNNNNIRGNMGNNSYNMLQGATDTQETTEVEEVEAVHAAGGSGNVTVSSRNRSSTSGRRNSTNSNNSGNNSHKARMPNDAGQIDTIVSAAMAHNKANSNNHAAKEAIERLKKGPAQVTQPSLVQKAAPLTNRNFQPAAPAAPTTPAAISVEEEDEYNSTTNQLGATANTTESDTDPDAMQGVELTSLHNASSNTYEESNNAPVGEQTGGDPDAMDEEKY